MAEAASQSRRLSEEKATLEGMSMPETRGETPDARENWFSSPEAFEARRKFFASLGLVDGCDEREREPTGSEPEEATDGSDADPQQEEEEEEEGDEEEGDGENCLPPVLCLFCVFASRDLRCLLTHMHARHGLNLAEPRGQWHPSRRHRSPSASSSAAASSARDHAVSELPDLHAYYRIALINYLRSVGPRPEERLRACAEATRGTTPDGEFLENPEDNHTAAFARVKEAFLALRADSPCWREERFLQPAWAEDRLLWEEAGFTSDDQSEDETEADREKGPRAKDRSGQGANRGKEEQRSTTEKRRKEGPCGGGGEDCREAKAICEDGPQPQESASEEDRQYFAGYAELSIHREMISDTARTEAYRDFILQNRDLFADKVVLDVGCGTGILSLFCAQAGARKVIGVDGAAGIARVAEKIVKANRFDHIVQVLNAKVEDVVLVWADDSGERVEAISRDVFLTAPSRRKVQVDVIVSEWMGYCLLFESMLYTVFHARDEYLKPDGLLVPSRAVMGVFGADCDSRIGAMRGLAFDKPIYGLDFSLLHLPDSVLLRHAEVAELSPDCLLSDPSPFCLIDLYSATTEQVQALRAPFSVDLTRRPSHRSLPTSSSSSSALAAVACPTLTTLLIYFECFFERTREGHAGDAPISFFAGPQSFGMARKLGIAAATTGGDACSAAAARQPERRETRAGFVCLSTSPLCQGTHWKQTLLHLRDASGKRVALTPRWAASAEEEAAREEKSGERTSDESDARQRAAVDILEGFLSLNPDPERSRSLVLTVEMQRLPCQGENGEICIGPCVNSFSMA
ncbi:UNVERIFIED_CONTAM: histone arginine methyltransferase PRMT3 [Hammondia hammondi]|eukprot:XP_008888569.1 histone arginine methyltransferase PRMT3 [Hammondia hammondi]